MRIEVNKTGVDRISLLLRLFSVYYDWKLQTRDIEIVSEMYYKNYLLIKEGIKDPAIRYKVVFSKEHKDEITAKYSIAYNTIANTLTKMRKIGLITDTDLNEQIGAIDLGKSPLELITIIND